MSFPNNTPQQFQIPIPFRALSRNNSNTSTAGSNNKGDLSSTNSIASNRRQLSKCQLVDRRQLFSTCASSTPIRSFQRANISSIVKSRAADNDPASQGFLTSTLSGQNSVSNSQTPSSLFTSVFERSGSLRMFSGSQRYRQSSSSNRTTSRTPEIYSFNFGDLSSYANESQTKLVESNNKREN